MLSLSFGASCAFEGCLRQNANTRKNVAHMGIAIVACFECTFTTARSPPPSCHILWTPARCKKTSPHNLERAGNKACLPWWPSSPAILIVDVLRRAGGQASGDCGRPEQARSACSRQMLRKSSTRTRCDREGSLLNNEELECLAPDSEYSECRVYPKRAKPMPHRPR